MLTVTDEVTEQVLLSSSNKKWHGVHSTVLLKAYNCHILVSTVCHSCYYLGEKHS